MLILARSLCTKTASCKQQQQQQQQHPCLLTTNPFFVMTKTFPGASPGALPAGLPRLAPLARQKRESG
eukprot:11581872-Alexandrium_andersonii.AAC.1